MSEEIQGWKPPIFYDITTNETRIATQADLDALTAIQRAYSDVMTHHRQIEERHTNLARELHDIRTRDQ
jgi:hypothetical protein